MARIVDRFSAVAEGYARYRPAYPEDLIRFVISHVRRRELAWDAGTGNGQAASLLARTFTHVVGTDISAAQIARAAHAPNITYFNTPAENTGLADHSVDLITAAQAAHWFDIPAFAKEVQKVSRKGAVLAIWGYALLRISPAVDRAILHLYREILDGYWDPQREIVHRGYTDLQFPFQEMRSREFSLTSMQDAHTLLGYLRTWSAVGKYKAAHQTDPVTFVEREIETAFEGRRIPCVTPLFLRMWGVD